MLSRPVDYLDSGCADPHWPVFKLADSAIVSGGILGTFADCASHHLSSGSEHAYSVLNRAFMG